MTAHCLTRCAHTGSLLGDGTSRAVYELARLRQFDDERWWYLLLASVGTAVIALVWTMARRDTVQQRAPIRYLLFGLRVGAFAGLLLFFLDPQRRAVHQSVQNSQVLLLLDVSQSMGLADSAADAVKPVAPSRLEQVAGSLDKRPLINDLRRGHDVLVRTFDRDTKRLLLLPKNGRRLPAAAAGRSAPETPAPAANGAVAGKVDWHGLLTPQGTETRLGDALRDAIHDQRAAPVSGLIVISDGGQNAGADPDVAIQLARNAEIPIYTVGVGSNQEPAGARVSDLVAPDKAYRGDAFTVTGYVQAHGLAGRTVTVELLVQEAPDNAGTGSPRASERIVLGGDGDVVPVRFELAGNEPGRQTYRLRLIPPAEDRDSADNEQTVDVEIVDRTSRILLLAGAATREYRFVRNLLWRDEDVTVAVILQASVPGIAQDADQVLDTLPGTREDLYRYDALVAFDPDWTRLNAEQVTLLENWVADQAAGLIAIAGPIHTTALALDPRLTAIRDLYPVVFPRRIALAADAPPGSEHPLSLEFTPEGNEAPFLWLGETATASAAVWSSFPGFYSCYPARQAKPGASVYAVLSDPDTSLDGTQSVLMAEHFYGSGRVFYLGSGEMWRLRSLDESCFEQFYTKLLRHVSEGRLLRGSVRGLLLVERDRYVLGDTVILRAQLTDARHDPLVAEHVTAQVTCPDGTAQPVSMERDPDRPGMFFGQLAARQEGGYRIDLPVPDTIDQQLTRRIQVKVPDLERQRPQRNDALLSEIAVRTGGHYYVGLDAAAGLGGAPPVAARLRDRTEVTTIVGAPDRRFEEQLMTWLLLAICGLLFLEWLIRRLCRLA